MRSTEPNFLIDLHARWPVGALLTIDFFEMPTLDLYITGKIRPG